ncbi:DUF2004 domain-containing protein [Clostridium baratii]
MKINDLIFGELEYEYIWYKNITIEFCGSLTEIILMINGDEDGDFEEEQYKAYNSLIEKWSDLQEDILDSILKYYKDQRHQLGYDIENNEKYPLIETREKLLQNITLAGIVIPYSGTYEGRESGLTFDCTWDEENGVGVYLLDENIIEVGYQDIIL